MSAVKTGRHAEYKDSGVEWIGETPSHWLMIRNKDIFYERGSLSQSGDETLLTVSHITGVTRRSEKNVNMFMAETMEGYKNCKKGDLVINTMWAWMGALGTANEDGICSPAYGVYAPKRSIPYSSKYFDYLYRTPGAISEMTRNSKGIVSSRLRLYPKDFFQIFTALPPHHEQARIASYLDIKTVQIDRRIDLLTQKAAQYGKLKQSLINETITRGLDKSVLKKDSGVEWIGEIPAHWSVLRLKEICSIQKGEVFDFDTEAEEGLFPYFNGGMTPSGYSNFSNMPSGVIAVSEGGASSGYTQFMETSFWCGAHCYAIFSKTKNKKYLYYCIKGLEHVLSELKTGSAMPNLKRSEISNFLVPITKNREEQASIAAYLDEKTAQIDRVIKAINIQIDKLKDLRKSLINDVVTGKIKVVSQGMAV
jgi:type I restriction enzyme S subunit